MIPAQLDLSKLPFLKAAKQVMNKLETENPTVLSENTRMQTEREEKSEGLASTESEGFTTERVINSNLPESIKKIMLDKAIENNNYSTYNESDEKEMPLPQPGLKKHKFLNENVRPNNSDMITVSRSELDAIINERLVDLLATSYNKNITEQAIKRTIKALITEGKLSVKKKI